jgi:DNA helicase-2/ATP-dependent DNA helicase PcrA
MTEIEKLCFPWWVGWEDELRRLFAAAAKQENVLDYDDLLLYGEQLRAVAELASEVARRFDHVLVDEYPDTNLLQTRSSWG